MFTNLNQIVFFLLQLEFMLLKIDFLLLDHGLLEYFTQLILTTHARIVQLVSSTQNIQTLVAELTGKSIVLLWNYPEVVADFYQHIDDWYVVQFIREDRLQVLRLLQAKSAYLVDFQSHS